MAEWVVAVASIVGLLSLYFLWEQFRILGVQLGVLNAQLKETHTQLTADHERSRREMAIELMKFWCSHTNNTAPFFVCGRRIVQELDETQCKKLNTLEPFTLEPKYAHLVDCFRADFSHRLPKYDGHTNVAENKLELNKAELASLRMVAVSYLNFLETVATAWRHNIGDRQIIEDEFKKIISTDTNEFVLEKFRKVTGVYPSIQELTKVLKERAEKRDSKNPIA